VTWVVADGAPDSRRNLLSAALSAANARQGCTFDALRDALTRPSSVRGPRARHRPRPAVEFVVSRWVRRFHSSSSIENDKLAYEPANSRPAGSG